MTTEATEHVPGQVPLLDTPSPALREVPPPAADTPAAPKRRGRPPGSKTRNRSTGTSTPAPQTRTRTAKPAGPDYQRSVTMVLGLVATVAGAVSPITSACIEVNADGVATAWANLAHQNESVGRVLEKLSGGSAWSDAIAQTAMMAGMIACANGALRGTPLDAMFRGSVENIAAQLPGYIPTTPAAQPAEPVGL